MPVRSQVTPVLCLLLCLSGFAQASTLAKSTLEASPVEDIVARYPAMMSEGVRRGLNQSGMTDPLVVTTLAVQLGLASALSVFQGSGESGFAKLQQMIESRRQQTRAVVAQEVYDIYLYTYRDLSVDELRDYIGFLETDSGATFTRVVTASIQDSITRPLATVGRQLARFLAPFEVE